MRSCGVPLAMSLEGFDGIVVHHTLDQTRVNRARPPPHEQREFRRAKGCRHFIEKWAIVRFYCRKKCCIRKKIAGNQPRGGSRVGLPRLCCLIVTQQTT